MADEDVVVPPRSQQKDAGRALHHQLQAVELYLKRHTFTRIQQRISHSLFSTANYVVTLAAVVAHTRDCHSADYIAFFMQISPSLLRAYQELDEQYDLLGHGERIEQIIATVKTCSFLPSQHEYEPQASAADHRGLVR